MKSTALRLMAVALAGASLSAAASGWYASGGTWTNRKKITIDHTKVAGTLTNFPVLVSMLDDDLKTADRGGFVRSANGGDILFTSADGVTKLAHEIESYNGMTGGLSAWVNVPQLSATADTVLYIYFGNSAATDESNRAGVWDSNYYGVYHLSDADSGDLRDSTTRGQALVRGQKGRPSLDLGGGLIAGAQQFGKSHADYALTGADDVQSAASTLSFWVRRGEEYLTAGARGVVVSSAAGAGDVEFRSTPDANTLAVNADGAYRPIASKVGSGWNFLTIARNGTVLKVYLNGALTQTFTINARAGLTFRGLGSVSGTASLAGDMDEVRWSHTDRPAVWTMTEYANQSAPEAFYGVGSLEPALASTISSVVQLFQRTDDLPASMKGVEDVSKRTMNARHFRNTTDGTWTAVIGQGINQADGKGGLAPVLPGVWQDGLGGWEVRGGAFTVKIPKMAKGHTVQHTYTASDGKAHSFAVNFPTLTYVSESTFRFAQSGLRWSLVSDPLRSEFSAVVAARRGSQTYSFDFDAGGAKVSVSEAGDLVSDDGARLSQAEMVRADGKVTDCSAWLVQGKTLSFTCDDSEFPQSAFPYTIDPTVYPPVSNAWGCTATAMNNRPTTGSCQSGGGSIADFVSGVPGFSANVTDDEQSYSFDTSSIPANSTISGAALNLGASGWYQSFNPPNDHCYLKAYSKTSWPPPWMGPNFSTPDVVNWQSSDSVYSFAIPSSSIWNPMSLQLRCTASESVAPSLPNGVTKAGVRWSLGNVSLTVTYTPPPINVTVNTSGASGSTVTVDGVNYSSPHTFQWTPGTNHTIAVNTPQSGGTGTQFLWNHWSDNGAVSHTVAPASATTYTAYFTTQYYLTTATTIGGTISPASGWYDNGAMPLLTATPYIGYPFLGFSGDLNTLANPVYLTMNGPKSVSASFVLAGAYSYYYIDPLGSTGGNWTSNGTVSTGAGGMTSTVAGGGTLISTVAIPGGGSLGESQAVLTLGASGGSYTSYLMASSDAMLGPTTRGTFYAVDVQSPTFTGAACSATMVLYRVIAGSVYTLGTTTAPCRSGTLVRAVKTASTVAVYADGVLYLQVADSSITSGKPGIGVRGAPGGNSIAQVQLGALDTVAPNAVDTKTVATSSFANRVDFHWKGTTDNSGGAGIAYYCLARTGGPTQCSRTVADLSDATVAAGTTYSYQLQATDYHLNVSSVTVPVTTPPASSIDPRRVGVRSTGAYWGGSGENIDVLSGNVNFTVPLVKAQARGGWGMAFNLIYNSENWRQDGATTWNLGEDVGYGYGWKLMAGSLTPVWGNFAIDHYTFTDSSGAEYRLNANAGGVWTSSSDSIYVTYDPSTNRLYFDDGSYWVMGCVSGGTEPDAGVMYPTLAEDSNGNQLWIRYAAGKGLVWGNSSARIVQIEDVRAPYAGGATYAFNYNTDSIPHLTGITNNIGTSEGYGLTYSGAQTLSSPFGDATAFDPVNRLSVLAITGVGLSYQFQADASGQLTQLTFPYGAYLKWGYGAWNYTGSRKQMEATSRVLSKDGTAGSEKSYTFYHSGEANSGTNTVHVRTDLDDPSGNGGRTWYFAQSGPTTGLLTTLERYNNPGRTVAASDAITWSQDPAGRWYVGSTTSSMNGTVIKKADQTLDTFGNVTQSRIYDGNLTLKRTYDNTYLSDSNYTSRYIRNRLYTSSVTGDGQTVGLVTNYYDYYTSVASWTDLPNVRQHDSAYGTGFSYRGDLTKRIDLTGTTTISYDIGGNVVGTVGPTGTSTGATYQFGSNYAAPAAITTGSLSENMQWNSFLGLTQDTGPNGDTASTAYDSYARPASTTSRTGQVTTYEYSTSAPWTVAAVTGTTTVRWSRKTLDGLGRTVKVESGTGARTTLPVSIVETAYDPCGCSPMGKVSSVSMPYANLATRVWTQYGYDGLGRTKRVTAPDTSAKTYVYAANTVTATDEAGKWKTYTTDALGNLVQVEEPNPAGGSWFTYYTYDLLNHLVGVNMPRPSGTQIRTFNYGTPPGPYLLDATNPETGTVTYTYQNGLMKTKTDAKGQQIKYDYDSYNRVTQVRHYPVANGSEDTCQQVNFAYDTNGVGGFQYLAGRLATRTYSACVSPDGFAKTRTDFIDMFSYTQAGQVQLKRLRVARTVTTQQGQQVVVQRDLDGSWTYDNEGKMTAATYPLGSAGPAGGTYTFGYNDLAQPTWMSDGTEGQGQKMISSVTYGPAGELISIAGQSYTESRSYNSRLQLTALNGVQFYYTSGANNGKLESQMDPASGETINYQYDSLNRLIAASSTQGWGQGFSYDGFGNLTGKTVLAGTVPTFSAAIAVDGSGHPTNRLVGWNYDANGNQTSNNGAWLSYDIENRLSFVSTGAGYGYDPDNRRVYLSNWTIAGGNWTLGTEEVDYFGVGGQKMGSYRLTADASGLNLGATGYNVYFGSKLVRKLDSMGNKAMMTPDRLGSFGKFYPYGEDRPSNPAGNDTEKFATYFRDSGTGLDYAVNRYYNSVSGRFLTPDPYVASGGPGDPGSWNRYGYVAGDPMSFYDPDGLMQRRPDPSPGPEPLPPTPTAPPPPPPPPEPGGGGVIPLNKGGFDTDPRKTGSTAWQYLNSVWADCLGYFTSDSRLSASDLENLLKGGMTWIDSRYVNATVDEYAHNGDKRSLIQYLGSATAAVIPGTSVVVVGSDYFTNETQTQQIAVAVHEALHIALKSFLAQTDIALAGWLMNWGFVPSTNSPQPSPFNSGQITDWIVGTKDHMSTVGGGCKNP